MIRGFEIPAHRLRQSENNRNRDDIRRYSIDYYNLGKLLWYHCKMLSLDGSRIKTIATSPSMVHMNASQIKVVALKNMFPFLQERCQRQVASTLCRFQQKDLNDAKLLVFICNLGIIV